MIYTQQQHNMLIVQHTQALIPATPTEFAE